ncbi:MAG TPA: CBS domain-containing protein [Gemmatimonadaceae bacterium]|nr:CBS domain-containing protein [Gemmatimonadaceae bacterium]
MENSAKFLNAFAAVEKLLRNIGGSDRRVPFYQMVDAAAMRSALVANKRDDLKEFADLRNAITHERRGGEVIAEPHDRIVAELQRLEDTLANPPRVVPTFAKLVRTLDLEAPIDKVLSFFVPRNFSQVPVVSDGHLVGLLTTNTVSRWLASHAKRQVVDVTEHKVSDALRQTEHVGNWTLMSRTALLADVVSAFDTAESGGKRLDAVLITHAGKVTEARLGIVTIHDMPKVLRELTRPARKHLAA